MQNFIKIHENDNVVVALNTIPAGTTITLEGDKTVTSNMEIPAGHKMAITDMAEGVQVIKYGYPIAASCNAYIF